MCLTTPLKIKTVKKKIATFENGRSVDVSLINRAKAGDWVLVNANLAIQKIPASEAGEIRRLLNIK